MDDLISRQALYEKTAEWEAQALYMVEKTMNDEDPTEWRKWSIILKERGAFKFDVADAPSAERKGKWIKYENMDSWCCSECMKDNCYAFSWNSKTGEYDELQDNFCPNCGADMRGEQDE